MRLLHVVPTYLPAWRYGGLIHSVHGLCKALAKRGHQVEVFTTNVDGDRDLDVPTGAAVDIDGVRVTYFPSTSLRRLYWSPELGRAVRQKIGGFSILHLHSIYLWPTFASARAASRAGVPYVVAPRGMLVKELVERKNRWMKAAWLSLIERKTLENADAIHFTSEVERQDAQPFGFNLPDSFVVANGIDPPVIPSERQPGDYFLFVGRINWKKGLDRLLEALALVPEAHLKIAGNDEENYRPQLEALARKHGVGARVEFLGFVDGSAKWDLYRGATALVLPSISENFGNVALEAMAARCPVVVTRSVGLAAAIEAAEAGIVIGNNSTELVEALRRIRTDPEAMAMGQNGRKLVEDHYTWDAIAAQMETAYQRIAHAGTDHSGHPHPQ